VGEEKRGRRGEWVVGVCHRDSSLFAGIPRAIAPKTREGVVHFFLVRVKVKIS
jgi:hypothetical protein